MSHTRSFLCWMSAGLFLCSCAATAEDLSLSTSAPQTNSSAFVGLNGYRRYFANNSLIGRPVPCTRDDKICFRHNLVFNPKNDRCEPLHTPCDRSGELLLAVDRTELEHGSGRVVGTCPKYGDPCPGYRMAYDDICYRREIVRDVICGSVAIFTLHFMGRTECLQGSVKPISVQQPEEDGSCMFPDLRNPDKERSIFFGDHMKSLLDNLTCERTQSACFSEGKIFVSGHEGCHTLLEQGPCPEDHVVGLDVQAANESRAEGACVHVRGGCPKGYKRMAFDDQCHQDREIEIAAPANIILNPYGRYAIVRLQGRSCFQHVFTMDQICTVRFTCNLIPPRPMSLPPAAKPYCGADDMGNCHLYEVESNPPEPEI